MKKVKTGMRAMTSDKPVRNVIAKNHDFPQLVRSLSVHKLFEKGLQPRQYFIYSEDELLGIEIEVEGIRYPETFQYYWKHKADGSLRNYGAEYASIPLRADQVEYALNHWNECIIKNNKPNFSQRTSTHVHLNVRDMTWEEIENMVLLYMIFERHFFLQTNQDREHSIFCVPIYKTDKTCVVLPIDQCSHNWNKYAALNLCTILGGESPMFGTIEFRHMHGTSDPSVLIPWINNILRLKAQALCMPAGEVRKLLETMNTTSEYLGLYTQTFGSQARPAAMQKADFEYCITMTKLGIFCPTSRYLMADGTCLAVQKYDKHSKKKVSVKLKMPQMIVNDVYHDPEDEPEFLPEPAELQPQTITTVPPPGNDIFQYWYTQNTVQTPMTPAQETAMAQALHTWATIQQEQTQAQTLNNILNGAA